MSSSSTEIESTSGLIRTRFVYFVAAIVVVIAGLASRRFRSLLPQFVAEYAGDTLRPLVLFPNRDICRQRLWGGKAVKRWE